MKKFIAIILLVVFGFSFEAAAANDDDLRVHLSGIKGAEFIGEYQKDGMNYYLVEKGDTTWVVCENLDVVTGVEAVGGVWDPENLVLTFYSSTSTTCLYPANFNQVIFNVTDDQYHWGF